MEEDKWLPPNPGSLLIAKPKKSFLPSFQSKAKRTIADERKERTFTWDISEHIRAIRKIVLKI